MIMLSSRRASAPMMWTSSWSRRSFSDKESRFTDVNGFQKIYLEIGTIELGSILPVLMQDLGSSIMFCSNFYFGLRITTRKSYRWKYSLRVLVSINPHSSNRPFHHSPTWKNSAVTSWITAQLSSTYKVTLMRVSSSFSFPVNPIISDKNACLHGTIHRSASDQLTNLRWKYLIQNELYPCPDHSPCQHQIL